MKMERHDGQWLAFVGSHPSSHETARWIGHGKLLGVPKSLYFELGVIDGLRLRRDAGNPGCHCIPGYLVEHSPYAVVGGA